MSKLGGKSKSDKAAIDLLKGEIKFNKNNKEEDKDDEESSNNDKHVNIEGDNEGGENDLDFFNNENEINNNQEENAEENINHINNDEINKINENNNRNNINDEITEIEEEKSNSIHTSINNNIHNSLHNSTNVLNNNEQNNNNNEQNNNNNEQNNNNNEQNNNNNNNYINENPFPYSNYVYDYRQQLFQAQQNFYNMSLFYYYNSNEIDQTKKNDMQSWDLERKYENGNPWEQHVIFENLRGAFLKKSFDPHYNYLISQIIKTEGKRCYPKIKIISNELKKQYLNLSLDISGTRVIQNLIKFLDEEELHNLNEELINDQNFEKLINDKNGNHVLQVLIKNLLNINDIVKLFEKIKKNAKNYCKTKYGSYVVEGLLAKMPINYIINLISEFKNENLLKNGFGIHIVQKILEKYNYSFNIDFIYKYLDEINIYDKLSFDELKNIRVSFSKIIQIILEKGNDNERKKLINKLMKERNKFILLFSDEYGNHIVQKVFQTANRGIKNTIINMLDEVQIENRNNFFGYVKKNILK